MFRLIDISRGTRGITLMETAIAISVALIGALGGYTLLANVRGTMAGNTAAIEAQQDARNIVERIARELREASPEKLWPDRMMYEGSDYIIFYTPRDENAKFIVDDQGKPEWRRAVAYIIDSESNEIHRHQLYMNDSPDITYDTYQFEVIAKNVEQLSFTQARDMVAVYVRTYTDRGEGEAGHSSRAYAEFQTKIKLRN